LSRCAKKNRRSCLSLVKIDPWPAVSCRKRDQGVMPPRGLLRRSTRLSHPKAAACGKVHVVNPSMWRASPTIHEPDGHRRRLPRRHALRAYRPPAYRLGRTGETRQSTGTERPLKGTRPGAQGLRRRTGPAAPSSSDGTVILTYSGSRCQTRRVSKIFGPGNRVNPATRTGGRGPQDSRSATSM
jgi:hypothetical protein